MADNQVLIQIRADVADINAKLAELKGNIGKVKDETDKIAVSSKMSFAILATGINQAIGVIQQIMSQIRQFTDAYSEAETAVMKLAVAMRNQGDYTKEALSDLEDFAKQIQKTTAYEDDFVIARMATLKTYGMTNDEIKKAIPAILDISTARRDEGMDATKAADLIGKAYIGNTDRLKRYGIVVEEGLDRAAKFESAMRQLNERFGGAAAAELDTYTGQVKQLKNQLNDIYEVIGKRLIQALRALQIVFDIVAAGFWTMVSDILSGLGWLISRLEEFAKWAGLNKIGEGLAIAGQKVNAGATYASGKFNENMGMISKHFDQMKKVGDIDSFVQKLKPGSRFIPPPEKDKAGEAARDAWAKTAREIQAEIDKEGLDPLEQTLVELDKKVADLMEKAAKLPTSKEREGAGTLIGQYKEAETNKAITEAANKGLDEQIKLEKGFEDLAKKKQAAKEAEINAQLTSLDIAEKEGTYHRDTLNERIRLLNLLLTMQETRLKDVDPKDTSAWNSQIAAINQTKLKLGELNVEQRPVFDALKKYSEEATDLWSNVGKAVGKTFKAMEDALVDFCMTGKFEFRDFANAIIKDLVRIAIQKSITGPLASAAGSALSIIGKGIMSLFHGGGVVGMDSPAGYRLVPASAFDGAPRYHSGIGPDEQAAILRRDETVLTPGQMKAIGNSGGGEYHTHVNMTIQALDSRSVSQSLAQHKAEIVGMVNEAYNKMGRRGPLGS